MAVWGSGPRRPAYGLVRVGCRHLLQLTTDSATDQMRTTDCHVGAPVFKAVVVYVDVGRVDPELESLILEQDTLV